MAQVRVEPYRSIWVQQYKEISQQIERVLGDKLISMHHVGSTSVPGLFAKPVIDVIPIVDDVREVDLFNEAFRQIGLEAMGEYGIAFRRFFKRPDQPFPCNVHIYEKNSTEANRLILFRDYLIKHPAVKLEYGNLKLQLAQKHPDDILKYCLEKTEFIERIDKISGYHGYRMVQVLSDLEKNAYLDITQQYDKLRMVGRSVKTNFEFNAKTDVFFVLRKDLDIIAAAHIRLKNDMAFIEQFAVKDAVEGMVDRLEFLRLLEKWIWYQGFEKVQVNTNYPEYFRENGFQLQSETVLMKELNGDKN